MKSLSQFLRVGSVFIYAIPVQNLSIGTSHTSVSSCCTGYHSSKQALTGIFLLISFLWQHCRIVERQLPHFNFQTYLLIKQQQGPCILGNLQKINYTLINFIALSVWSQGSESKPVARFQNTWPLNIHLRKLFPQSCSRQNLHTVFIFFLIDAKTMKCVFASFFKCIKQNKHQFTNNFHYSFTTGL